MTEVVLAGVDAKNAQCGPDSAPDVDDPDWRERVTSTDPRFQDLVPDEMPTLADYARAVSIERSRVADLTHQLRSAERAARWRLREFRARRSTRRSPMSWRWLPTRGPTRFDRSCSDWG